MQDKNNQKERILRKYPNRRIYDTGDSQYVPFSSIKKLIEKNIPIKIVDAKTNEDITRSVLIQIIAEEGFYHRNPFSLEFMKQLIQLEGNAKKSLFGEYLEKSLQSFSQLINQSSSISLTPDVMNNLLEEQNKIFIDITSSFINSWLTFTKRNDDSK